MKTFLAFVLGLFIAAGVIWVVSDSDARRDAKEVGRELGEGVNHAKEKVQDAVSDVHTAETKENLKEAGRQVADKAKEIISDASITASIKAEMAASPDVPALSIDVDTTDGLVTLSGKVSSIDQVRRAVEIASSAKGVRQVISTLQVNVANEAPKPPDSSS